jgi:hypothetical protein
MITYRQTAVVEPCWERGRHRGLPVRDHPDGRSGQRRAPQLGHLPGRGPAAPPAAPNRRRVWGGADRRVRQRRCGGQPDVRPVGHRHQPHRPSHRAASAGRGRGHRRARPGDLRSRPHGTNRPGARRGRRLHRRGPLLHLLNLLRQPQPSPSAACSATPSPASPPPRCCPSLAPNSPVDCSACSPPECSTRVRCPLGTIGRIRRCVTMDLLAAACEALLPKHAPDGTGCWPSRTDATAGAFPDVPAMSGRRRARPHPDVLGGRSCRGGRSGELDVVGVADGVVDAEPHAGWTGR